MNLIRSREELNAVWTALQQFVDNHEHVDDDDTPNTELAAALSVLSRLEMMVVEL